MPTSIIKKQGILQQANDWKLQADLDKKLQSQDIVQTSLKPDIVIQSAATSSLSLSNWQLLGRKDARVHMKWRKQSKQTYQLCAKNVDGNLAVPSRGGLSGLSSTISMEHIELPRHCRKTTQELQWKRSDKLQKEHPVSYGWKETRRTGSYPMRGSDHTSLHVYSYLRQKVINPCDNLHIKLTYQQ